MLIPLRSKVPWITIALHPAWATLQALAVVWLVARLRSRFLSILLAVAVVAVALLGIRQRDYESVFREMDMGQWSGAAQSREIAQAINRLTRDGDRVLITSFHYWKGLDPLAPCAVFTVYLDRKIEVLLRPHQSRFQDLLNAIRAYRIQWAVLSPEPGEEEKELFPGFIRDLGLRPVRLPGAFIFDVRGISGAVDREPTPPVGWNK